MKPKSYPMSIYEVHMVLFDVLCEVDRVFKENGIDYFLIFGSLLGCVRDDGPIKWDDDIDICVFAKDWERMNKALLDNIDQDKFFILNKYTKLGYPDWRFITRVGWNGTYRRMDYYQDTNNCSGIFIDIFKLTGVPKSKFKQQIWEVLLGVIDGVINLYSFRKGSYPNPYFVSKIIYEITKDKKEAVFWYYLRCRLQDKYSYGITEYITVPFGPFGVYKLKKAEYRMDWFSKKELRRFVVRDDNGKVVREGNFPIPYGYREVLEKTYGNWKKKPRLRITPKLSFWKDV